MDNSNSSNSSSTIIITITLKWSKKTYSIDIPQGELGLALKQRVESLTGVPVSRQKLLSKKNWKGALQDGYAITTTTSSSSSSLSVTLMGSAITLPEPPTSKTIFVEDLSQEELQQQHDEENKDTIAALQVPIHLWGSSQPKDSKDQQQEQHNYNRLVSGWSQVRIQQELLLNSPFQGKVAMRMGMELKRAYINDLAVLSDGTCVSAMDDGHIQLWKHASQQADVLHPGGATSVVALEKHIGFGTAGPSGIQLWSVEAEPILALSNPVPGTSLASLVSLGTGTKTCLAARFQITREINHGQFRLAPQNEVERRRRATAEAQEQAIQQALERASKSVGVWFGEDTDSLQFHILESAAPITCLVSLSHQGSTYLVAGDNQGGITLWQIMLEQGDFRRVGYLQFTSSCSVVCMEPLIDGRLAVSTRESSSSSSGSIISGATPLEISVPQAVHVLENVVTETPMVESSLTGHTKDSVECMCALPDGALLTGGGKMDGTLRLWSLNEKGAPQETVLSDVGYVFCLALLPGGPDGRFAVAAGRYNQVNLVV